MLRDMNRRLTLEIHPQVMVNDAILRELRSYVERELRAEMRVVRSSPDATHPVLAIFKGDWADPSLPARELLRAKMLEIGLTPAPRTASLAQSRVPSGYGMAFWGGQNSGVVITGNVELRNNAAGGLYAESLTNSHISGLSVSDDRGDQAPSLGIDIGHLEDSAFEDNEIAGFSRGARIQTAVRSPIRGNRIYSSNIDGPNFEAALLKIQEALQTISDDNERELGELHLQQIARAAEQGSPIEGPWSRLINWVGTAGGLVASGAVLWNAVAALGKAAGLEVPPAPEGLGQ